MTPVQSFPIAAVVRAVGVILLVWFCAGAAIGERKVEVTQDEFRALILSKLLPYISEWPDSDTQAVVGVVGKEPFIETLRELVRNQKVQGREVVVKEVELANPMSKCHILFVPASSTDQWQEFSRRYGIDRLLTVGEAPDFASHKTGGALRLVYNERTVEVNPQNARRAGFELNSKLLKIFRIVR